MRHSIFQFIRNTEGELYSLLEEAGFATPREVASASVRKRQDRALVEFHYLNSSDCCLYLTSSRSPIRDAVLAGFDMDAVRQAVADYATVLFAYRDELRKSVAHVQDLVDGTKFTRCVGHEGERETVQSDLDDLSRLLSSDASSGQAGFVHKLDNDIDRYLAARGRRDSGVDWCTLDQIVRYLPVPVDAERKRGYEQYLGHSWFTEPVQDWMDVHANLQSCRWPWEQLAALTDLLVLSPWVGMREDSYVEFFATMAKHIQAVVPFETKSEEEKNQTATNTKDLQRRWTNAVEAIASKKGGGRLPRLRFIQFSLSNPVAPLGAIRVVHNRAKDWEEFESGFAQKLRDIGHRLSMDLTYCVCHGVMSTLWGQGIELTRNNHPLRDVFDLLVPCWSVTLPSAEGEITYPNDVLKKTAQRYKGGMAEPIDQRVDVTREFDPIGPIEFVPFFEIPRASDARFRRSALDTHWTRLQQVFAHVASDHQDFNVGQIEDIQDSGQAESRPASLASQTFELSTCLRWAAARIHHEWELTPGAKKKVLEAHKADLVNCSIGLMLASEAFGVGKVNELQMIEEHVRSIENMGASAPELTCPVNFSSGELSEICEVLLEYLFVPVADEHIDDFKNRIWRSQKTRNFAKYKEFAARFNVGFEFRDIKTGQWMPLDEIDWRNLMIAITW